MATLKQPAGAFGFGDTWDMGGVTQPPDMGYDLQGGMQGGSFLPPMPNEGIERMPGPVQPGQPRQSPVQTVGKPFDYEGGRDAWMSGKYGLSEDGIKAWNDEYGLLRNYNGGDVGELANGGGQIDLLEAFKSGNPTRATWTAAGGNGPNANGGGTPAGGGAGGPGGGAGGGGMAEIMDQLKKLFPDGAFNKDLVNTRTNIARDQLNSFSKSRNASNQAKLAERGLIGSGAEQTAQNRAEADIADQYSQAVSGIFGDESQRADARMIQALQLAAGMSEAEAQLLLDSQLGNRGLDVQRELGLGNIGLGYHRTNADYNLGRGRLELDQNQGDMDAMIRLLEQLYGGANTSAGGRY